MKVAFLLHGFPGLSETFILNQINGLIEKGINIKILANSPSGETTVNSELYKYDLVVNNTRYYNKEHTKSEYLSTLFKVIPNLRRKQHFQ